MAANIHFHVNDKDLIDNLTLPCETDSRHLSPLHRWPHWLHHQIHLSPLDETDDAVVNEAVIANGDAVGPVTGSDLRR